MKAELHWMTSRHLPQVVAIENESFEFPWWEPDFLRCIRHTPCFGIVAEHRRKVIGYIIYEVLLEKARILNLAVSKDVRRNGIGRQLVDAIQTAARDTGRRVVLEVRDTNLDAHLFFRAIGFQAVKILPGFYKETGDDAYGFVWRPNTKGTLCSSYNADRVKA